MRKSPFRSSTQGPAANTSTPADRNPASGMHPRPFQAFSTRLGHGRTTQLIRELQSGQLQLSHRGEPSERAADALAEKLANAAPLTTAAPTGDDRGHALPQELRDSWERVTGRDWSGIRLHTGPEAARFAASVHAKAATHGQDVYFAEGRYAPHTRGGQRLLSHEVAHALLHADRPVVHREEENTEDPTLYSPDGGMTPVAGYPAPRKKRTDPIIIGGDIPGPHYADGTPADASLESQESRPDTGAPGSTKAPEEQAAAAAPLSLSLDAFLAATKESKLGISSIQYVPALAGLRLESADADKSGFIDTPRKWQRLFSLLSGGKSSVQLRRDGTTTPEAATLAELALLIHSAELQKLIGPVSQHEMVTLVGMSDTSIAEAAALRKRVAVQLITDVNDGADRVRQPDGELIDLGKDDQIPAFVDSLGLPGPVATGVSQALVATGQSGRREMGELARVWAGAYHQGSIPARLLLSGHGDGTWISGNDADFIRRENVLALGKAMPDAAAQIYSIHLGSCQHGWEPRFKGFLEVFPNLQVLWGYAGTSPSGAVAQTHQTIWEKDTHSFPEGGGSIQRSEVKNTPRGDVTTVWTRDHGYDGPALRPLEQLRATAQGKLQYLHDCMEGVSDPGEPHHGFADEYYQLLQELTSYPEAEAEWKPIREQVLRLRFCKEKKIGKAFQTRHRELISTTYSSLGLKVPDFGQLDRKATVEAIRGFQRQADTAGEKSAANREMLRFLQGLLDLSPEEVRFEDIL